jgi:endonuclease/exonuclease/phosphatase family metal-dependent hydrolase
MKPSIALGLLLGLLSACATPHEARVLSYNIHHGQGEDGRFDLGRIAAVIRASGADLVALQEVDVGTARAGGVDQAAELGRLTGMHAVFGEAMPYDGGSYGEAILSAWDVAVRDVIPLPASQGHEPRCVVLVGVVPPWGGPLLHFAGTHLDHTVGDTNRLAQVRTLCATIQASGAPILLAGDLNSSPRSAPMVAFLAAGWRPSDADLAPTYPSANPTEKIDWFLAAPGLPGRVVDVEVLDEPLASDHAPLRARWVLP